MYNRTASSKYIYRYICIIILLLISTGIFYVCLRCFTTFYYSDGILKEKKNIVIAVSTYAVLFLILGRSLRAFKIGVERTANLLSAEFLTVWLAIIFAILISAVVIRDYFLFYKLLRLYVLAAIAQSICLSGLLVTMIQIYKRVFPPLLLLEIYGERNNNLREKINGLVYKYKIQKSVGYKDANSIIRKEAHKYDAVIINDIPSVEEKHILKLCFDLGIRVYLVPKISDYIIHSAENLYLIDTPLFLFRNIGLNRHQLIVKRFCDITMSVLALIVTCPILFITAIAIKLEDGGPVFFIQERCTLDEKKFKIMKFRTMIENAEKDGNPQPARGNDDRITKVGAIIRPTRIDELPQLVNILKGEMSIVGPRPERVEHVEKYSRDIPEFSLRHKVKGGLTGLAQVYGKYNTSALDKLKMDLNYILNYSLLLDIQIIFETIKILFQKRSSEGFPEEDISSLR